MCVNAIYSVISPEGCAAILWKDASMAGTAAEALRLRAADLLEAGIVDAVVAEPSGGAPADPAAAAMFLRDALTATLHDLLDRSPDHLIRERRRRFRRFGAQAATDLEGGQRDRTPEFVGS
jgi:acetyl-CoA carboxylase carboxyl transferase subunit beta